MSNNAANVSAGKPKIGGAVFRAPAGTTLPTDASSTLNEAFVALGYVSSDGVVISRSSTQTDLEAWGGDVVDVLETSVKDTVKLKLIEALNTDVLKAVHGSGNVSGTLANGVAVNVGDDGAEEGCWVVDMILRGNTAKRIVIPRGKITELGDITYADNVPIGYEVTIRCLKDSSGKSRYEYLKTVSSGTSAS